MKNADVAFMEKVREVMERPITPAFEVREFKARVYEEIGEELGKWVYKVSKMYKDVRVVNIHWENALTNDKRAIITISHAPMPYKK